MKLAIAVEKEFSKDEILEGYLNIVLFNRDAYGVEAASKYFFSTTAKDLTLPAERAAGRCGQQPVDLQPELNPEGAPAPQPRDRAPC